MISEVYFAQLKISFHKAFWGSSEVVEQYFQTLSINLVFLALPRFKGKILPIPSLGDDAQDGEKENRNLWYILSLAMVRDALAV